MKTRIAVIIILIAEIFSALLVGMSLLPIEDFYHKTVTPPPYLTLAFLTTFVLLLIAACLLWRKTTRLIWFGCLILACINIGVMCWIAKYLWNSYCDGIYLIGPEIGLAKISIISAAITALSLPFFLSDIKRIIRMTTAGKTENRNNSSFPVIAFILIVSIPIVIILMESCSGGTFCVTRQSAYTTIQEEMKNAVAEYRSRANDSSQMPIISANATFTPTNSNSSYYIIDISPLLTSNGGILWEVPDSCSELPGPDNDNCDGGASGCSNTSHYIWGMDEYGNVYSMFLNFDNVNPCACDGCDDFQGVWP